MQQHSQAMVARMRQEATDIFRAGVRAADPGQAVARSLTCGPSGRPVIAGVELGQSSILRVVAFGKAACSMAEAAAESVSRQALDDAGIVVVNRENLRRLPGFRIFAAGHPVPDSVGSEAAAAVSEYVGEAREGDGLLVLISGGGSALLPAPVEGIALEDKVEVTRQLLVSGATIQEINSVRKHLSNLKGGRLAQLAMPARIEALILSDVIGDDLSSVASGPTVADPTSYLDAYRVLETYGPLNSAPAAVRQHLQRGCRGELPETPKPGDAVFRRVRNVLVGSNAQSLQAAAQAAEVLGYRVLIASSELCGEAREAGAELARHASERVAGSPPLAVLSGGETTVTVRGHGRGGRSQEMALAFALAGSGAETPWVFLSGGTDGRDGPTDAAGGVVDSGTLERGERRGRNPLLDLDDNNAYAFLKSAGDLLKTGNTGTNVADLQVLLLR